MSSIEKIDFSVAFKGRKHSLKPMRVIDKIGTVTFYTAGHFVDQRHVRMLDKNVILDVHTLYYHESKAFHDPGQYVYYSDGRDILKTDLWDLVEQCSEGEREINEFGLLYKKYIKENIPVHEFVEMYML